MLLKEHDIRDSTTRTKKSVLDSMVRIKSKAYDTGDIDSYYRITIILFLAMNKLISYQETHYLNSGMKNDSYIEKYDADMQDRIQCALRKRSFVYDLTEIYNRYKNKSDDTIMKHFQNYLLS